MPVSLASSEVWSLSRANAKEPMLRRRASIVIGGAMDQQQSTAGEQNRNSSRNSKNKATGASGWIRTETRALESRIPMGLVRS